MKKTLIKNNWRVLLDWVEPATNNNPNSSAKAISENVRTFAQEAWLWSRRNFLESQKIIIGFKVQFMAYESHSLAADLFTKSTHIYRGRESFAARPLRSQKYIVGIYCSSRFSSLSKVKEATEMIQSETQVASFTFHNDKHKDTSEITISFNWHHLHLSENSNK